MSEPLTLTDFVSPPAAALEPFDFTWPDGQAQPAGGGALAIPPVDGKLLMVGGFALAALVLLMLPPPARGRRR